MAFSKVILLLKNDQKCNLKIEKMAKVMAFFLRERKNSATHPLAAVTIPPLQVRLGDADMDLSVDDGNWVQEVRVSRFVSHPLYTGFAYFDVAVMELESEVRLNRHVLPICLPLTRRAFDLDSLAERSASLTGYGKQDRQGQQKKRRLRRTRLQESNSIKYMVQGCQLKLGLLTKLHCHYNFAFTPGTSTPW